MSTMTSAVEAAEQAALTSYLLVPPARSRQVPCLEAALRNARVTMERGEALWLATLGYLVVPEMLGKVVARSPTRFCDRSGSKMSFVVGAREFAARAVSLADAEALYGLRCALAHEYGLRSARSSTRHIFGLTQQGPLVRHPVTPWQMITDSEGCRAWPSPLADNQTWVNVLEVGRFVEELVTNIRAEHAAGNVILAPGVDAMQLRNFGQFLVI